MINDYDEDLDDLTRLPGSFYERLQEFIHSLPEPHKMSCRLLFAIFERTNKLRDKGYSLDSRPELKEDFEYLFGLLEKHVSTLHPVPTSTTTD